MFIRYHRLIEDQRVSVMTGRPEIFIATPCYGGLVTQGYMQSVLSLMVYAGSHDFDLSLGMLGHDALITRSRNTLLSRFLHETTASHILFIDADIAFAPTQVSRMLDAGKDIVAGMYPLKVLQWDHRAQARNQAGEAMETAALLYVGVPCLGAELERDGSFVTAVYCGTGFMMIARAAIVSMVAAYPQTRYRAIHAFPLPVGAQAEQHALFDCMIDPATGDYLSEDFTFCRRWRDIGGKIWLDQAGALTHCGQHDFRGDVTARF